MLDIWSWASNYSATAVYSAVGLLLANLGYACYKYCKWHNDARDYFYETAFFNELSNVCLGKHVNLPDAPEDIIDDDDDVNDVKMLPIERKLLACDNRHCSRNAIRRIIHYIDTAEYSIDVAAYTLYAFPFVEALRNAASRNVTLRVITDKGEVSSTPWSRNKLVLGVPVRGPRHPTNMMHHKFFVIDSPTRIAEIRAAKGRKQPPRKCRGIVITGSLNITSRALNGNWENVIITSNPQLVQQYTEEFDHIWQYLVEKPAPSTPVKRLIQDDEDDENDWGKDVE